MLGCNIHTKPNNGLFHGDLKNPLRKLVKFNKNISKINQTYIGNKISKIKGAISLSKNSEISPEFFFTDVNSRTKCENQRTRF
jgi:hypothetical protein